MDLNNGSSPKNPSNEQTGTSLPPDASFPAASFSTAGKELLPYLEDRSRTPALLPPPPLRPAREVTDYALYQARFGALADLPASENPEREVQRGTLISRALSLADFLRSKVIGQEKAIEFISERVINWATSLGTDRESPVKIVLVGNTGIGKSYFGELIAEHLKISHFSTNMQNYESGDEASASAFARWAANASAKLKNNYGMVQIEEVDKVAEFNERGDMLRNAVIGVINDILNTGQFGHQSPNGAYSVGDLSSQLVFVTLNFPRNVYGLMDAHPDLTTVEDVCERHELATTKAADVNNALLKLFRPNTLRRFRDDISVLEPFQEQQFRELIDLEIKRTASRIANEHTRIELEVTPRFKEMLFRETVVPANQAGGVVSGVPKMLETAVNSAKFRLQSNEVSGSLGLRTLQIRIDYAQEVGEVRVETRFKDLEKPSSELHGFEVRYRPRFEFEVVPAAHETEIPQRQFEVAVHEIGHIKPHLDLAVPFHFVRVVPISAEAGGFVKSSLRGAQSARAQWARVLINLGARAMERVIFSPEPLDRKASYMALGFGSGGDLTENTMMIFKMLARKGLDPDLGALNLGNHPTTEYTTQPLSKKLYARARRLVTRAEDFLVEDLLSSHPKEFYLTKIAELARRGRMTQDQVYESWSEYKNPFRGTARPDYLHDPDRTAIFRGALGLSDQQPEEIAQTSERAKRYLDRALRYIFELK